MLVCLVGRAAVGETVKMAIKTVCGFWPDPAAIHSGSFLTSAGKYLSWAGSVSKKKKSFEVAGGLWPRATVALPTQMDTNLTVELKLHGSLLLLAADVILCC